MSLKRKASFTALPNSPLVPAPSEWGMVTDGSTHLHSRTRKRFRDDRPSDQVIYRKSLASPLWHPPLIMSTFNLTDSWQKTPYDGSSPPKSSRSLHKPPIWIQWTQSQLLKHQKLTPDNKHYTDSFNKNPSNHRLSDHPAQHLHLVPMRPRSLRRTSCAARRLIK